MPPLNPHTDDHLSFSLHAQPIRATDRGGLFIVGVHPPLAGVIAIRWGTNTMKVFLRATEMIKTRIAINAEYKGCFTLQVLCNSP